VDTQTYSPATQKERQEARKQLGIPKDSHVVLFTGSAHHPNIEALSYIHQELHPLSNERSFFLIAGSVTSRPAKAPRLLETGPVEDMMLCFQAADTAINPMFSGSGMNQKVCQYLASGLPVLSSPFGARGFETGEQKGILCFENTREFLDLLFPLQEDLEKRTRFQNAARAYAEKRLSWDLISRERLATLQ
jgi:glycosyltransferase involved in cell wall biosynthesis